MSSKAQDPTRIVIVAAIDGSQASEDVLRTSSVLGQTLAGVELHVVHVVEPIVPSEGGFVTAPLEGGRTIMDRTLVQAREYFAGPLVGHLATGAPWPEVLQLATDLQADLIVVGSHRKKSVERWLLGSVSEQIVRRASCAVLVARPKDYTAFSGPEIEPPCVNCVAVQRQTSGKTLWCTRHDHSQKHPHGRLHYEAPQSFAVGSMLIRPE